MLKKLGMVSTLGLLACVGCNFLAYAAVTQSIINTAVIGGAVIGAAALPNLLAGLRGLIPGL